MEFHSADLFLSARQLYDGGWRAEDKEELMETYALSDEDADFVCEELKRRETWYAVVKNGKYTGRGSFDKEYAIDMMHHMNADRVDIIDRRVHGHEVCVGQINDVMIGG